LRVNITYSVELEDVPSEVARMLEECEDSFRSIHGMFDQIKINQVLDMIDDLDKIRISLARLDLRLGDSMDILTGYVQAMAQLPSAQQENINSQLEGENEKI
jgi:hypothetical protein